jgi:hypothetical protein
MKSFKEWLWEKDFNQILFEVLQIKNLEILKMPDNQKEIKKLKSTIYDNIKKKGTFFNIQKNNQTIDFNSLEPKDIVNSIRHKLTNYDDEWELFDKTKDEGFNDYKINFSHPLNKDEIKVFNLKDENDISDYWKAFVGAVYDTVNHIIDNIKNIIKLNEEFVELLKIENKHWFNNKRLNYHKPPPSEKKQTLIGILQKIRKQKEDEPSNEDEPLNPDKLSEFFNNYYYNMNYQKNNFYYS